MSEHTDNAAARVLRNHGAGIGVGLVLAVLGGLAVRWIGNNRQAPPPRKTMQFTVVKVQPQPQPVKPPPPPPVAQPKVEEQPQATRVELKATDIPPPDAPRPQSSEPAAGGHLALAAEGEGPGDAFNLAGNVNGRGLLSGGGGLGDGTGDGVGQGESSGNAFAWYYVKVKSALEDALRKQKRLTTAAARVELKIWAEPSGRISRIQLVRSTGDASLDEAIKSVAGL